MSVNSYTSTTNYSSYALCHTRTGASILTALAISYILLLPLFIFVLYVGCQRWRKRHSVAMAAMTSHSDIFTYNVVVLEIFCVLAALMSCYGAYTDRSKAEKSGMEIFSMISPGQTLFHLFTCVERYLAVVHPITYLRLRQASGVMIRNLSTGSVWLLCCGLMGLMKLDFLTSIICGLVFSLVAVGVVPFCSISVLCVLIRPGPGDVGRNQKRVDQSKQRAFYTVTAIMAALLLRVGSSLACTVMYSSLALNPSHLCLMVWSAAWFSLPSSLVLPLLFLHRAGKLPGCKLNTESV